MHFIPTALLLYSSSTHPPSLPPVIRYFGLCMWRGGNANRVTVFSFDWQIYSLKLRPWPRPLPPFLDLTSSSRLIRFVANRYFARHVLDALMVKKFSSAFSYIYETCRLRASVRWDTCNGSSFVVCIRRVRRGRIEGCTYFPYGLNYTYAKDSAFAVEYFWTRFGWGCSFVGRELDEYEWIDLRISKFINNSM